MSRFLARWLGGMLVHCACFPVYTNISSVFLIVSCLTTFGTPRYLLCFSYHISWLLLLLLFWMLMFSLLFSVFFYFCIFHFAALMFVIWPKVVLEIASLSLRGRGKVYVRSTLSRPRSWDYTGFVVVSLKCVYLYYAFTHCLEGAVNVVILCTY